VAQTIENNNDVQPDDMKELVDNLRDVLADMRQRGADFNDAETIKEVVKRHQQICDNINQRRKLDRK
jgi:predicted outer membrane protein